MRRLMAAAGTVCVLAAAPGLAQPGGQDWYGYQYDEPRGGGQANFGQRITVLSNRIQIGIQTGAITRTEAAPLREQLRQIQQLERRHAPGGFNQAERAQILPRIQSLRQQIAGAERNDYASPQTRDVQQLDDEVGYSLERNDRDVGYGDGRDSYRGDRRRFDDRRGYDDGVGFEEDGQIRVGDRAPAGLGGVAYGLRSRYPETERYTYHSYGGRIYQVERHTGVIARIYEVERYGR